ncbi:MAG: hypothetical protein M0Q16_06895 [Candidatus Cloacimonetes bacterium]|jgi:hypothetical protein|nr:hypothetical protein [Candidatus Cloacimonadota bacterium]
MSKFHDEFFRNGSPEHDKLMMKCLSKDGLAAIRNVLDFGDLFNAHYRTRDDEKIVVCGGRMFKPGHAPKFTKEPIYGEAEPDKNLFDFGNRPPIIGYNRRCSFSDNCGSPKCKWITDGELYDTHPVDFAPGEYEVSTSYETEVIVRNGTFIIGYADAVIKFKWNGHVDAHLKTLPGVVWKKYSPMEVSSEVLLEAKPTLNSIGEVIRQLKTYNAALCYHGCRELKMVIATYTKLDQDASDYLANEKISVVTFAV